MLTTLASVALALASLVLGETAQIGSLSVRRASLFGFEVQGPSRAHVLDLDEAAELLTRAARLASVAPVSAPAFAGAPADLLVEPYDVGAGLRSETWRKGPAATRREGALRRALGASVTRRSGKITKRLTAELGGDRETIETVEFTYAASSRVPPIATS